MFTKDFNTCGHEHNDFDRDANEGTCFDCGAHADGWHIEFDADEDGTCGSDVVVDWRAPADDAIA